MEDATTIAAVAGAVAAAAGVLVTKGLGAWGKYREEQAKIRRLEQEARQQRREQTREPVVGELKGIIEDLRGQVRDMQAAQASQRRDTLRIYRALADCEASRADQERRLRSLEGRPPPSPAENRAAAEHVADALEKAQPPEEGHP